MKQIIIISWGCIKRAFYWISHSLRKDPAIKLTREKQLVKILSYGVSEADFFSGMQATVNYKGSAAITTENEINISDTEQASLSMNELSEYEKNRFIFFKFLTYQGYYNEGFAVDEIPSYYASRIPDDEEDASKKDKKS